MNIFTRDVLTSTPITTTCTALGPNQYTAGPVDTAAIFPAALPAVTTFAF